LPSTFTVMNLADDGPGSLRQAILDANGAGGPDAVVFAAHLHGTIALTSGELTIADDVTVDGPGANRLTISGSDASRVFSILGSAHVSMDGLRIAHGRANGSSPLMPSAGGGIFNLGSLTLTDVVLSDNRAVGDPNAVVPVNPVFNLAGGGLGGGLVNYGTLIVTGCTFSANQALGADHTDSSAFSFPGPAFAGNGLGGAISNEGTATVTGCEFVGNLGLAGSDCRGDFAAIGGGGAVHNDAVLTVSGSSFRQNRAQGGNNSVSPFHNGHALGGAIQSGSLLPLAGGPAASLTVQGCTLDHNLSQGGNDNTVTLPLAFVPPADAPDNGYGGGILVYEGSATISQSTLSHNQAQGGAGGAAQKGSLGVGGGIFFFSFLGGVTATVTDCTLSHNDAIGGPGRSGGRGGDGLGGGIAIGGLGSPFAAPGTAVISNTTLDHNLAQGGGGGSGGDGLGGGVFNDAGSTLSVTTSTIDHNQAQGGRVARRGADGRGIGGGVYNLGVLSVDLLTVIAHNRASTSNDNVFP
jgi:hypothetical protein